MSRNVFFNEVYQDRHSQKSRYINPRFVSVSRFHARAVYVDNNRVFKRKIAKQGEKIFNIVLPQGKKYDGAIAITLPHSSEGCITEIKQQANIGSTGNLQIIVSYTIPPGGTIYFRLRAYCQSLTPAQQHNNDKTGVEVLHLINNQSVERLSSLMNNKKRVALLISGADALKLISTGLFSQGKWNFAMGARGPTVSINPTWELVVIVGILASAAVGAIAIAALTAIVILGIIHGYHINIKEFEAGSVSVGGENINLSFPTLVLDLNPEQEG